MRRGWTLLLALMAVGCTADRADGSRKADDSGETGKGSGAPAAAPVLALQVDDTTSVWFASGRADTGAAGAPCLERVMEIRAGARVIPIPLLYSGESPTPVNDSTIQVHIWRHCVPADLYRVHLSTGQPTRVGP